ncbi:hypothetical protein CERZMDRAFT_103187 [Cercospora zeae-maydis SCOH1-5]|uniref:Uncharacterized protein n=1 Tax=Cercospora zeae-maydis SCOH1-5 TaxID=717836 RepID=A0A6A6EZ13_9PEZI|nr:hypothetical protein CERZMDRAFT_103187 [Cercospora zeae-maydis SCOH1-5]
MSPPPAALSDQKSARVAWGEILDSKDELVPLSAGCERRQAILSGTAVGVLMIGTCNTCTNFPAAFRHDTLPPPSLASPLMTFRPSSATRARSSSAGMNSNWAKLAAFSLEQGTEEGPLDGRWSVSPFSVLRVRV